MGTGRPKLGVEQREGLFAGFLEQMENDIKDAIATETTEDPCLAVMIEVTAVSLQEERPLFPNPLDEPLLYRKYFKKWVREGLEEASRMEKLIDPQEIVKKYASRR